MRVRGAAIRVVLTMIVVAVIASPADGAGVSVGERPAAASTGQRYAVPQVTAGWRARMLARVNVVRALAGVPLVAMCPALMTSAQQYADLMAREDFFDHVGPDGSSPWDRMIASGYRWRQAAENLAAGQGTVYEVMQTWRASPGHLASLTDPGFTHIGFGYAQSSSARYPTYWVQDLGAGGRC
jgi:uncharacterized protein YkwD